MKTERQGVLEYKETGESTMSDRRKKAQEAAGISYLAAEYLSPLGPMVLCARESGLCGLWFQDQKYYGGKILRQAEFVSLTDEAGESSKETEASLFHLHQAALWLDRYFQGENPSTEDLKLAPQGTVFQLAVWNALLKISYGETTTYGEIARELARARGLHSMSAQAVGSAVGHNPVSVIIPCHRVLGRDGSLTGYAGGLERKAALLQHENPFRYSAHAESQEDSVSKKKS